MPRWLTTLLEAAGLLIGAAFLAEPVLVLRRRRRQAADRAAGLGIAGSARVRVGRAGGRALGGSCRRRLASCWPIMTGWW